MLARFRSFKWPVVLTGHDIQDHAWLHRFLVDLSSIASFVSLPSLLDKLDSGVLPSKPVLALTFDDGYRSVYEKILPICRKLEIPFTTFVCSEALGGGSALWYDRVTHAACSMRPQQMLKYWDLQHIEPKSIRDVLSALKSLPFEHVLAGIERLESERRIDKAPLYSRYMTSDILAEIAIDPLVTVGSHTHRHPILSNLDPTEQQREIEICANMVSSFFEGERLFAYPNGKSEDYDRNTISILQSLGFRAAFTTNDRAAKPADDRYMVPRVGFSEGDSVGRILLKCSIPWLSVSEMRERRFRSKVRSSLRTSANVILHRH